MERITTQRQIDEAILAELREIKELLIQIATPEPVSSSKLKKPTNK